jgi:signal transduction histidine kinase
MACREASAYPRGMSSEAGTLTTARRVLAGLPWGVLLLSACVSASMAWRLDASGGPARYWWALAAGVMTLAVAWRHRYPLQTWAIVTAACAVLIVFLPGPHSAGVQVPLPVFAAPLIALYSVTVRTSRPRGRAALLISATALGVALSREYLIGTGSAVAAGLRCGPSPGISCVAVPKAGTVAGNNQLAGLQIVLIFLGLLVAAWALGERARANSEAVTAVAERAAALVAERAGRERAAAADERARIAAELHDITAHHISVVALQAGAARMLAESGQPTDVGLLCGIESASRHAMTEIRQALGVIRSTADGPVPQPGAAQLPGLAAGLARTGLAVTLEGSAGSLPSHLDLAVYRIVQESLSNVLRHSAASTALVRFRRPAGHLEIVVTDHGPARERGPASGSVTPGGQGLLGLRERVQQLGGQLRAGTRPGEGFEVQAVLPVPEAGPATGKDTPRLETRQASLPAVATP